MSTGSEATRADLQYRTIGGLAQSMATRCPDLEGLVDSEEGGRRWTYPELSQAVLDAGRAFMAAGLQKGDRVAIWAPNIPEWVIAGLGALTAGGVLVPLNSRFKGAEAAYIMAKSEARLLLCVNGFLGFDYVSALRNSGEALPALERIVVLRGEVAPDTESFESFLAGASAVTEAAVRARLDSISPDDLSDIIFTSGTTGRPKGAMCTHAQTLRVFDEWSDMVGIRRGDRYLIVNPFFHTFGYKAGLVSCLLKGITVIPQPVFDVPTTLRIVDREKVTVLPGPPTLFQSILESPDRKQFELSSLRAAVTGAAAVPVELIKRMRSELTFKTIITGYGLTETTGTVSMCDINDDAETIANTSGKALRGFEIKVVDTDGNEVPRETAGEIWARGYNVMQGYYKEPERTAETITPDGWLKTGDIGIMDERGYIRITDRIKDMFIVGGFNAYPAEIENMLLAHPSIAQVAVVGVPDERMGEVGWAFVVPRTGATIDAEAIIAWSRERMANFKVPRRVVEVDALPLNASGKVLKFELRDRAKDLLTRNL